MNAEKTIQRLQSLIDFCFEEFDQMTEDSWFRYDCNVCGKYDLTSKTYMKDSHVHCTECVEAICDECMLTCGDERIKEVRNHCPIR